MADKRLAALQQSFQRALLEPTADMPEGIVSDRVSADRRFAVYANAYRGRLSDILAEDHPKLVTLLGVEEALRCFEAYHLAYPSDHFSVRYYGRHLAQFLTDASPYATHPLLAEMAEFEGKMLDTLDAADGERLTLDTLQQVSPEDWPNLVFQWHPSVRLMKSRWQVPIIWQTIEAGETSTLPESPGQPVLWLLWRDALQCEFMSCDPLLMIIAEGISAGHTFATLCEQVCDAYDEEEAPQLAWGCLQQLLEAGLLLHVQPAL